MSGTELRQTRSRTDLPLPVVVTLGLVAIAACSLTVIGSDALWLSALGDVVKTTRSVPTGVPFAAAPSADWVNTTVLGQLLFAGFEAPGRAGVVLAQVVATVLTLAVVGWSARRHDSPPGAVALVLVAVALGAATGFLIARAQLLSLVPYVLLLALVRAQQVRPSRAIWWAVPLVALWGNLHGAVLVGVAVLGCYLLFSRLRHDPWTAVGVGIATLLATCLNPGLLRAPRYYLGVFGGEATSDEAGMWARLTPTNAFDVALVIILVVLAVAAFRRRQPPWEYAAAAGLAVAVAVAARNGIWLVLFLAVPAATSFSRPTADLERADLEPGGARVRPWHRPTAIVVAVVLAAAVFASRVPSFDAADDEARRLVAATRGEVVLAPEPLVESLAAAGAKVWVSNPLDAFSSADQAAYLAFMRGDVREASAALDVADVVVAPTGSAPAAAAQLHGFTKAENVGSVGIFRRATP